MSDTEGTILVGTNHRQISGLPGHSRPAKPKGETRESKNAAANHCRKKRIGSVKGRIQFCHAGLVSVSVLWLLALYSDIVYVCNQCKIVRLCKKSKKRM